ncbi:MAG: FAD binding domain-containing protein [Pseudomonadota bacterium]
MDLNTITGVSRPTAREHLPAPSASTAFLGGGTWLFSEPQPHLDHLVDLSGLGWPALVASPDGLEIAATCTLAQLNAATFPPHWPAAALVQPCCRALMGSFKVWNMASVGGNVCMALPAGPMTSLVAGLEGECLIWCPDGTDRRVSIFDFITGAHRTSLAPGEVLRSLHLPARTLTRQAALRRASLTQQGRSAVFVIGTRDPAHDDFTLAVSAALPRPRRFHFNAAPDAATLRERLGSELSPDAYFDDLHGTPDWRRQMTLRLSEEVRAELCGGDAP